MINVQCGCPDNHKHRQRNGKTLGTRWCTADGCKCAHSYVSERGMERMHWPPTTITLAPGGRCIITRDA